MKKKKAKKKLCKVKGCTTWFTPHNSLVSVCSSPCAFKLVEQRKAEKEKAERIRNKQKIEALRPRSWHLEKAKKACNKYIRERDKYKPCVSCGNTNNVKYDAGHYITVSSCGALRFHPMNIHKQCSKNCNTSLSGNIVEYRKAMLKIVGEEVLDYLENFRQFKIISIDEIKEIEQHYKDLYKELIKEDLKWLK